MTETIPASPEGAWAEIAALGQELREFRAPTPAGIKVAYGRNPEAAARDLRQASDHLVALQRRAHDAHRRLYGAGVIDPPGAPWWNGASAAASQAIGAARAALQSCIRSERRRERLAAAARGLGPVWGVGLDVVRLSETIMGRSRPTRRALRAPASGARRPRPRRPRSRATRQRGPDDDADPEPPRARRYRWGALEAAARFLLEALRAGPLPSAEVIAGAEAAGHTERSLGRARKELRIKPRRVGGVGGCWLMELPEALPFPWSKLLKQQPADGDPDDIVDCESDARPPPVDRPRRRGGGLVHVGEFLPSILERLPRQAEERAALVEACRVRAYRLRLARRHGRPLPMDAGLGAAA